MRPSHTTTFTVRAPLGEVRERLSSTGGLRHLLHEHTEAGTFPPTSTVWSRSPTTFAMIEPQPPGPHPAPEHTISLRVTVAPAHPDSQTQASIIAGAVATWVETWALAPAGRDTRVTRTWTEHQQFRYRWLPAHWLRSLVARSDCARIARAWDGQQAEGVVKYAS